MAISKIKLIGLEGKLVQYGEKDVKTTASQTGGSASYKGSASLTFDKAYASAPIVITNVKENPAFWLSSASSISPTGANINVAGNANNSTKTVQWIAIGNPAT